MKTALAALLLAVSVPALGAQTAAVRRGVVIHVKVTGTVVPEDVFRLKSTIDGRVESLPATSGSWRGADQPLATLAYKELAAMIDARGAQNQALMEDRWSSVYRPTPVRCPSTCYVLKVYAKARAWVKPQEVLFEAARSLKAVGRVSPEDASLIRGGMMMTFWAVKDPKRRLTGKVERFALDVRGEKVGGTVTVDLAPDRSLDPGTEWEGEIIPMQKPNALMVPTAALIQHDGATYLPVRVSTGITSSEFTEITSKIDEKREILILDDSQLRGAERHTATAERAASAADAAPNAPAADAAAPAERQPSSADDKSYGGEDPYGEQ